jgi:hypothetical protein
MNRITVIDPGRLWTGLSWNFSTVKKGEVVKPGCIIYLVGDESPRDSAMKQLIRDNGLEATECRMCGVKPLPNIYQAYRELQQQQVTDIACISVRYDLETGGYVFLEKAMSLDGFADLSILCSPEEIAC